MSESTTARRYRLAVAVLAGAVTWIAIGLPGLFALRTVSSAYALAEPTKAYTFPMLISRLTVGVVCTLAAGAVATASAKGSVSASYWLGAVLLLPSMAMHFFMVWTDYPAWYHAAYLIPLMPWTILGGRLAGNLQR